MLLLLFEEQRMCLCFLFQNLTLEAHGINDFLEKQL